MFDLIALVGDAQTQKTNSQYHFGSSALYFIIYLVLVKDTEKECKKRREKNEKGLIWIIFDKHQEEIKWIF